MSQFSTVNPYDGRLIANYNHISPEELEASLEKAAACYRSSKSKRMRVQERATLLKKLAAEFRAASEDLSRSMSMEMGKALKDSKAEVEKSASTFDYYAENLERLLAPVDVKSNYAKASIVKDPIGPVLAIMPWNFPLWQVTRFAAPAVGIGNPILLKHSDLTAGSAKIIEAVFARVSEDLLFNLQIDHEQASQVIADRRVAAVTLTGSARAGKEVAETAGKHLKKSVLELGGSDPYVVLADANVNQAAKVCAHARMTNNGQSCVAAKRFIVHHSIFESFLEKFRSEVETLKLGDPMQAETIVGTLAAKKFQKQLLEQCVQIESVGAEKIFDLAPSTHFDSSSHDAFFPARAYKVKKDMEMAFTEEFFGPVALMFSFSSEPEALDLANRSIYGLGGAVFSADQERAETFARAMESGFIAINDQVKSDPRLPFGGVKDSGYGRELSDYGFNEFCNVKTITSGSESASRRVE